MSAVGVHSANGRGGERPPGKPAGIATQLPSDAAQTPEAAQGDCRGSVRPAVLRDAYIESLRVQNDSERTVENRISYLNALIIWCDMEDEEETAEEGCESREDTSNPANHD